MNGMIFQEKTILSRVFVGCVQGARNPMFISVHENDITLEKEPAREEVLRYFEPINAIKQYFLLLISIANQICE